MSVATRLGSSVSLLNGLWAAYLSLGLLNASTSCPSGGCPATAWTYLPSILLTAAVILSLDSLISFVGFRASFTLGAALSAAVLVLVVLQWGSIGNLGASLSLLLSAAAVVADVVASRPVRALSEQSHPLNLPVFG